MAKFCGKCGAKLDEATGLCPNCDSNKLNEQTAKPKSVDTPKPKRNTVPVEEKSLSKKAAKKKRKADKKEEKKDKKKEKWASMTFGQKVRKKILKLFLLVSILVALTAVLIGELAYLGVVDIPLLSDFNRKNILKILNDRAIVVEETSIVMDTDTMGKATIVVQIPDYELLFKEAYSSENPEQYLIKALALGNYEIRESKEVATVSVDDGVPTVHSDEVVHKLLEETMINAINALSEEEK